MVGGGERSVAWSTSASFLPLKNFNYIHVKDFNQGTSEMNSSNANSPDHKISITAVINS